MSNNRDITSPAELAELWESTMRRLVKDTLEMTVTEQQRHIEAQMHLNQGYADRTASQKIRVRMLHLVDFYKSKLYVDTSS